MQPIMRLKAKKVMDVKTVEVMSTGEQMMEALVEHNVTRIMAIRINFYPNSLIYDSDIIKVVEIVMICKDINARSVIRHLIV